MKLKFFFKNIAFLLTRDMQQRFEDAEGDIDDNHSDLLLDIERLQRQHDALKAQMMFMFKEFGSLHESIENVVLPLPSHKVCIPNPSILEAADWVTAAYFCNTCGISDHVLVAENAYNVWKATHFGKEPTPSRHNSSYPVYPVGFLQDLINDRYADIINK